MRNPRFYWGWLTLMLVVFSIIPLTAQPLLPALFYSGDMNNSGRTALSYLTKTGYWVGGIQAPASSAASSFRFCDAPNNCSTKYASGSAVSFATPTTWIRQGANGQINVTGGKYYTFTVKDVATQGNPDSEGVVIETAGQPVSIGSVTRTSTFVAPGQTQVITATTSAALPTGQGVYLRYTKDNYSTSTVVAMTSTSATTFTATIPASCNTANTDVSYYVFSSGSGLSLTGAQSNRYTINLNDNAGSNYAYTVASRWFTIATGNWSNPATWAANQVPVSGANVTIDHNVTLDIDATVTNLDISVSRTFTAGTRTLTINSGGALTVNGSFTRGTSTVAFPGSGTIFGSAVLHNVAIGGGVDFNNSTLAGTLTINNEGAIADNDPPTYQTGSTIRYNSGGNYPQNAEWPQTGGPTNITIANGTRVFLQGFRTIGSSGTLFLESGRLVLNGNVLQNQGTVTRTASTTDNFIECAASATSFGFYEQNLSNGDTKAFEVGVNDEYAPVTITRTVGLNSGLFGVRVFPEVLTNGTSGTTYADGRVQLSWEITELGATTLASTVELQWNGSAESGSFDRGSALISRSSEGSEYLAVGGLQSRSGSDPYTQNVTGITGFSVFAVLNNSVLPVEWLSFRGRSLQNEVELTWQTASEHNSDYYAVQRQVGSTWETIGEVTAAGNSRVTNRYQYVDKSPLTGLNYYRLQQVDFDGTRDYSRIVAVAHATQSAIKVYPNPTADRIWLSISAATVRLYDNNGRLLQKFAEIDPFTPIDLSPLPPGTYQLQLFDARGELLATPGWVRKQ